MPVPGMLVPRVAGRDCILLTGEQTFHQFYMLFNTSYQQAGFMVDCLRSDIHSWRNP